MYNKYRLASQSDLDGNVRPAHPQMYRRVWNKSVASEDDIHIEHSYQCGEASANHLQTNRSVGDRSKDGKKDPRPADGGLGAIHIETHANAIRCAWVKRATKGLWANGLQMKVIEPNNICFISEYMHICIQA